MSGGRPEDSTLAAGCSVGISGGRPEGTTLAKGYNVGMSGGRPEDSTLAAGCSVGISGGRPEGTTLAEGYTMLECQVAVQKVQLWTEGIVWADITILVLISVDVIFLQTGTHHPAC